MGQRKAFYRPGIRAVYQNNETTFLTNKEVKPVDPVQMNIYHSITYRKDLNRLHF